MADYYSILKKAVSALPDNSAEARATVYVKARAAIERQLNGLNPPPGPDLIAKQMGQLEAAINVVEAEHAPPPPPPALEPEPQPVSEVDALAAEMEKLLDKPAPSATTSDAPSILTGAASTIADAASVSEGVADLGATAKDAGAGAIDQAGGLIDDAGEAVLDAGANLGTDATVAMGNVADTVSDAGSSVLAGAGETLPSGTQVAGAAGAAAAAIPGLGQSQAEAAPAIEEPPATAQMPDIPPAAQHDALAAQINAENPRKRGFLGRVIPYVVGLAVLGGGGYALWLNKEPLMDMVADLRGNGAQTQTQTDTAAETGTDNAPAETDTAETETDTAADETPTVRTVKTVEITPENTGTDTTEPQETDTSEAQPAQPKEDVRLGSDGESVVVEPTQEAPVTEPETTAEETETPLVVEQQPVEEAPTEPVEVTEVGENAQETAPEQPAATVAVGEKAYLYEEGGAGEGALRSNGAMVWSLSTASPAEGAPPEAVILGTLDIPDRGLKMDLSIKRNVDESLSASHLIEMNFTLAGGFAGGGIDNVARFVMKNAEGARGEGLIAVPAKIADGFFMIALNNLPQAQETNRNLLLESSWVDIPLGYSTGRRALVTFEKGPVGDQVFRDAFADWQNR